MSLLVPIIYQYHCKLSVIYFYPSVKSREGIWENIIKCLPPFVQRQQPRSNSSSAQTLHSSRFLPRAFLLLLLSFCCFSSSIACLSCSPSFPAVLQILSHPNHGHRLLHSCRSTLGLIRWLVVQLRAPRSSGSSRELHAELRRACEKKQIHGDFFDSKP